MAGIGKPLKFSTPQELEAVIDAYFNSTPFEHWSVTGLALLVGSKQLLSDYENREGYKEIVVKARLMVENSYEIGLRKDGGSGNIFALKNFGWVDKQEHAVDARVEMQENRKAVVERLIERLKK